MNLTTNYLNLSLRNPLLAGACPLSHHIEPMKELQDAGIAAVVMHSLFEEQIVGQQMVDLYHARCFADSRDQMVDYYPKRAKYALDRDAYLKHIGALKRALEIPVIASLNACTTRAWSRYAKSIEDAGADALELNVYFVAADPKRDSSEIENDVREIVQAVSEATNIPVAVKLPPFFTGMANFAGKLQDAGADALVLFNRVYGPDVNLDAMQLTTEPRRSNSAELLLRLQWLAILSSQLEIDLACNGGAHTASDVLRSIAVGASCVQMVSALLDHGPSHVTKVLSGIEDWLRESNIHSLHSVKGQLTLRFCPDPEGFERGAYLRTILGWKDAGGVLK
jgi:dihydroorotate dehydrogenase (fumarate)